MPWDETCVDAYLGLANVYIGRGNYDKALEILQNALDKTENNESIVTKIKEISCPYLTEDLLGDEDLQISGIPINQLNIYEVASLIQSDWVGDTIRATDTYYEYSISREGANGRLSIMDVYQDFDSESLTHVFYNSWVNYQSSTSFLEVDIGIRDITTGDYIEDVMRKIGFSDDGVEQFSDITGKGFWVINGEIVEDEVNTFEEGTLSIKHILEDYCCEFRFHNGRLDWVSIDSLS